MKKRIYAFALAFAMLLGIFALPAAAETESGTPGTLPGQLDGRCAGRRNGICRH